MWRSVVCFYIGGSYKFARCSTFRLVAWRGYIMCLNGFEMLFYDLEGSRAFVRQIATCGTRFLKSRLSLHNNRTTLANTPPSSSTPR